MRDATMADLPAIVALLADDVLGRSRETLSEPLDPAYLAGFAAIEAAANERLCVAVLGGQVVGCVQLTYLPGIAHRGAWRGQLEGVRVAAALRGTGLGRQMIQWAVEQCRARGCSTVQLTTNAARVDAQRFYRSLGFEGTHLGMKLALDRPPPQPGEG